MLRWFLIQSRRLHSITQLIALVALIGAAIFSLVASAPAVAEPLTHADSLGWAYRASARLPDGLYAALATVDPYIQQSELVASDGAAYDEFGSAVALSSDGSTALVGAWYKTVNGHSVQGAAYVFARSGAAWTQQAELTASNGAVRDGFGNSVALSSDGSSALIGALEKKVNGNTNQGAAYVFTRSGAIWTQQDELTASDGAAGDLFGFSVALSGDGSTALIGARYKTVNGLSYQGAAYVFTGSGSSWTQQAELIASNGTAGDEFGYSVALSSSGSTALVGASWKNVNDNSIRGAAYVFTGSGSSWTQQTELIASNGAANDSFGGSVALSSDGSMALAGACCKTVNGNSWQGAAYIFGSPLLDSIGMYRSGTFYLRLHNSTGNADIAVAFNPTTKPYPVVGDWTGAGFDTVGVYDQSNGLFSLCTANNTTSCANAANRIQFVLGIPNDQPLAGRWNAAFSHFGGGVFRPSNGLIYLKNALTTGFADYTMVLGIPGDVGLAGDWNGDGLDSLGVYRPTNSTFYLNDQTCNCSLVGTYQFAYGLGGDAPVVGDWVGQGHDGVGLFRKTNGYTYLRNELTTGFADIAFVYGLAGDVPVAGHWQLTYPPVAKPPTSAPAAPAPTGVGD